MKRAKRSAASLVTALAILVGVALPVMAPFLDNNAEAANGASDIKMIYGNPTGDPAVNVNAWNDRRNKGDQWALGTLCEPNYEKTTLTDGLVSKALGDRFDNMSQWIDKSDDDLRRHFYSTINDTTAGFKDLNNNRGTINEQVGLNYVKWIRDHMNQTVNVIAFYNSPGSSLNANCGGSDVGSAHFVLVPAEGDPSNPFAFIGRQIDILPDNNCGAGRPCSPTTMGRGGVLRFAVPQRNGANTAGELDYYDELGNYHDNSRITVKGVAEPVGSVVVGSARNLSFQDVAHINIEYVLNGTTFQEQYTDYRWDNVNAYFLNKTNQPTRQQITVEGAGQDTSVNPLSNPGSVHIPFINVGMCAAGGFKGPGFNISYNDNGNAATYPDNRAIDRFQAGINSVGNCGDINFYDYDVNGSAIKPQNGLPTPVKLPAGNVGNAKIWFYSNGSNGLVNVFTSAAANEANYTGSYAQNASTSNPTYYDHNGAGCAYIGRVKTSSGAPISGGGVIAVNWTLYRENRNCQPIGGMGTVNVSALVNASLYEQQVTASTPAPDLSTPAEAQIACDAAKISLSWLICPIAYGAISMAGSFDNAISEMLNISVNKYFNEDDSKTPGPAFYTAWNSFRVIAMAIIVIAGLVMIISQALGFDLVDAYTIKKILPRLLIAVIAIAISWSLMKAFITFSDVLGFGVRNLIYAPFSGLPNAEIGASTANILAILGGAAFLGLGAIGLLSFALTALLAVFIGFSLLVFREMVVVFAVIVAPLAIALSVLPNTRKAWQFWQNTTTGALLMFPIIAGFIAIGHTFAAVAGNTGDSVIRQFVVIIAYFAPYFLIPAAFRIAGGLVATIGGIVNDRSRGAFDRLKQFRSNRIQQNMQKMATGERFKGNNRLSDAFNRTTEGLNTFARSEDKMGFLTDNNVRAAAYQQQRRINSAKYGQTDRAQANQENDPLLMAQTYAEGEAAARAGFARGDWGTEMQNPERIEAAIAAAKAGGGFSRQKADYATRRLAHTGTGYTSIDQVQQTVARVAGNNEEMASSLLGEINAVTKGVGRHDLAPGYGMHMQMWRDIQNRGGAQANIAARQQAYADAYNISIANGQTEQQARLAAETVAANTGILTRAEARRAYVQAGKDNDSVTRGRDKKTGVINISDAVAEEFLIAEHNMNDVSLSAEARATARQEWARLGSMINKDAASGTYISTSNLEEMRKRLFTPTSGERVTMQAGSAGPILVPSEGRRGLAAVGSPGQVQQNPVTGQIEPTLVVERYAQDVKDDKGNVIYKKNDIVRDAYNNPVYKRDANTGAPIQAKNATHDPEVDEIARIHGPQGMGPNPRDPGF